MTHKVKKGSPAAAQGPPRPERPVVNCLCCGKIYKTRETSRDVLHVLGAACLSTHAHGAVPHDITPPLRVSSPHRLCSAELGGVCTFCGAKLALACGAQSEERPSAAERRAGSGAAAGSSGGAADSGALDKVTEAVAFKDRLVSSSLATSHIENFQQVQERLPVALRARWSMTATPQGARKSSMTRAISLRWTPTPGSPTRCLPSAPTCLHSGTCLPRNTQACLETGQLCSKPGWPRAGASGTERAGAGSS